MAFRVFISLLLISLSDLPLTSPSRDAPVNQKNNMNLLVDQKVQVQNQCEH